MELIKLQTSDKENSEKYVLKVQDKDVAYGYIFDREINPIEIYVEKDFQSNGYGKFLFNSLLKILKNNGLKGVVFKIDENNFKIVNIIKHSGALEIGREFPQVKFMLKL